MYFAILRLMFQNDKYLVTEWFYYNDGILDIAEFSILTAYEIGQELGGN